MKLTLFKTKKPNPPIEISKVYKVGELKGSFNDRVAYQFKHEIELKLRGQ